jgi:Protein of unknown function (DUF1569)
MSKVMYEPHLLQPQVYNNLLERLHNLSPSSQALWGKMNVAQMLAHVTANLEMAMSNKKVTQAFIGRIFGSMAKQQFLTKAVPKNVGTLSALKISDQREFQKEKERLLRGLEGFYQGGEAGITRQPHEFFGRLTADEWARLQYLHLDHHFKQFGV